MTAKKLENDLFRYDYPPRVRAIAAWIMGAFWICAAAFVVVDVLHARFSSWLPSWGWRLTNVALLVLLLAVGIAQLAAISMFRPVIIGPEKVGIHNPWVFRDRNNPDTYLGRQTYPWTSLTRIEKRPSAILPAISVMRLYRGRFMFPFNSLMTDYDELVALVERYAKTYKIPLTYDDEGAAAS